MSASGRREARARWGRPIRWLLAVVVFGTVLELASVVGLRLVDAHTYLETRTTRAILEEQSERIRAQLADGGLVELDPILGWRYRRGYDDGEHRINAEGLRSARPYAARVPAGTVRVAAFGDSFVYANEVSTEDAWATHAERVVDGLEVLNHGVGGYGTDQAFLRYLHEGDRHAPDVVLIGFAPVNLRRTVNVYRRFLASGELPLIKPRFRLDPGGELRLVPNPTPAREDWVALLEEPHAALRLGEHDAWYEPLVYKSPLYDLSAAVRLATTVGLGIWRRFAWSGRLLEGGRFRAASEAFRVQLALLRSFADSARVRGARPVVVIFPDRETVLQSPGDGAPLYQPLLDSLRVDPALPIFDLLDAFEAAAVAESRSAWFSPGGHYSATGNTVVAEWLGPRLRALGRPGPGG